MITTFDIKGFKSVKDIHLDCRRINLFIGEPNTGKSNILEALGFLSWCGCCVGVNLHDFVRFELMRDLFYDGLVEKDCWQLKVGGPVAFEIEFAGYDGGLHKFNNHHKKQFLSLTHEGTPLEHLLLLESGFIKFYRFKVSVKFATDQLGALLPPDGQNLVALAYSSQELRQLIADYFAPYGLRARINPYEHKIEVQKQSGDIDVVFPYHLTSDTLQRMIFYTVAIESNKGATLVFEEPESHAFPYYTKHLGERIALDENKNQYFIATHNPYLLTAILEKSAPGDVAVFATYYRNYETRVKPLTPDDMKWLFEADPFLGVSHLVEDLP